MAGIAALPGIPGIRAGGKQKKVPVGTTWADFVNFFWQGGQLKETNRASYRKGTRALRYIPVGKAVLSPRSRPGETVMFLVMSVSGAG